FVRTARAARGGALELHSGSAGHLTAARVMRARFDDPRLRAAADELADDLDARARPRARRPWRAIDATNLAHGWPGVLHALGAGRAPAPWLVDALARLARTARADTVPAPFRGTWCTGAAGLAMLWCRAFAATDDERFRRAARAAARTALAHEPARPH